VRRSHRPLFRSFGASVLLLLVAVLLAVPASGRAASPPPGRTLLSDLSAPSISPGGSSTLDYLLSDPPWFGNLSDLVLTFELYALNGYPGDAVGPVPVANAPVLVTPAGSGRSLNLTFPSFERGTSYAGSLDVVTSSATPGGTYAIRTALSFDENASAFLYESRGWFTESVWANATQGSGGSSTVNLTQLNVSGILPETAVYVAPSDWPVAIGALVGIGLVVVGLGAWLYFRRGPGSSSGVASDGSEPPKNAPKAFGTRRKSPGDSRNS
jgi:hypothetical protein